MWAADSGAEARNEPAQWPPIESGDRDERSTQSAEAARSDGRIRCDSNRTRISGQDTVLVLWRGKEAGDYQLPYVQTRTRRSVLREDLRAGEGLRVPVRKVQATEAPGCHLREVWRRGHPRESSSRAHGAHRTRESCRPHLVPEVPAIAHGPASRHDVARHRAHSLLRGIRRK